MLNWTVWNRTVFNFEIVLTLNSIVWNGTVWHLTVGKINVFLY